MRTINGLTAGLLTLLVAAGAPLAAADEPACDPTGERLFAAKCAACHSLSEGVHGVGPSLAGVMGRAVGSSPEYLYSPVMEHAGFAWSEAALDEFLEKPMGMLPGTTMAFGGLRRDDERAALICWLGRQG